MVCDWVAGYGSPTVCETKTIAWQEKHFSTAELAFYGDMSNCETEADKVYHHEVCVRP